MARMLEALKKLEARGERLTAPPPPAEPPPNPEPPAPPESLVVTQAVTSLDFAAAQLAKLTVCVDGLPLTSGESASECWEDGSKLAAIVENALAVPAAIETASEPNPVIDHQHTEKQSGQQVFNTQYPVLSTEYSVPPTQYSAGVTPAAIDARLPDASPPQTDRPLTAIERAALRTLNNPIQARPLIDLADRLEADTKQTASHTVVFASVGPSRGTPEALVHAGVLLTERRHAKVLLIDADLPRRALTQALNCERAQGLSEAVLGSNDKPCLPLATPHLHFLPAGLIPQLDAPATESRLEALLKSLGEMYGLVLIDGGQAGSPFTSTLARQSDATYLVVELGAVEAPQAQEALRDLRAAGARVLGCIAT